MIPFNTSYLLTYVLNVVMLAGNHALPMMLRFYIWLGTKVWRKGQVHETLHFLLDHPRRSVPFLSLISHFASSLTLISSSTSLLRHCCPSGRRTVYNTWYTKTRSADDQMLPVPIPKSSDLVLSFCASRLHVSPYFSLQNPVPP